MIIVIDDERTFRSERFRPAIYIRTEPMALGVLARLWTLQASAYGDPVDELWFDHDLGAGGDTRVVAQFLHSIALLGRPLQVDKIHVHTQNPVGADLLMTWLAFYNPIRAVLPEVR